MIQIHVPIIFEHIKAKYMNNTKILLCGAKPSALGGGPTHLRNMLASPLKNRYKLILFQTGSRGNESPALEEHSLRMLLRLITSPFMLAWQILYAWPAVVHLNSAMDNKAFWRDAVYVVICKLLRRKIVFQLHGGSLAAICSRKWMEYLVRHTFSLTDAVVLLANSELRDFEHLGITKGVVVIPNAVDTYQYRGAQVRVHSGRVQRLVYLGRLLREKGIFESIEAIEILRAEREYRDVELKIAGTGPVGEEIRRYIDERGLGACVKLVGAVFGNEKIKLLQDADVFLFPSYHPEGLPYCILESLAAGTPVITTRVGGIPDVVVDGVHGIFVNPKDPGEIVKAVQRLAQSEDALRAMSRDCVEWAIQNFGLERLAGQFIEVYEKVRNERVL